MGQTSAEQTLVEQQSLSHPQMRTPTSRMWYLWWSKPLEGQTRSMADRSDGHLHGPDPAMQTLGGWTSTGQTSAGSSLQTKQTSVGYFKSEGTLRGATSSKADLRVNQLQWRTSVGVNLSEGYTLAWQTPAMHILAWQILSEAKSPKEQTWYIYTLSMADLRGQTSAKQNSVGRPQRGKS